MLIATAAVLFIIAGALLFGISNGKWSTVGGFILLAGLIALAISMSGHTVRVF